MAKSPKTQAGPSSGDGADTEKAQKVWTFLCARLLDAHGDVVPDKMMSADALTHGGKVFTFFSTKGGGIGLGCRLGRDYPFDTLPTQNWQFLAPFKTKPPMKDWIVCTMDAAEHWDFLADEALRLARLNKGKS